MTELTLEQLRIRLAGQDRLAGVSARFAQGAPSAIIGPNGAGKSLTLRAIMGLLTGVEGLIRSDFQRPALVFQRPVLLRRSVRDNLRHALAHTPRQHRADLDELLVWGELTDRRDQSARALSGGEQQRLALVRALAGQPDLLLLDEPTASLDPGATLRIEQLISRVAAQGCKIILVTHSLPQARRLCTDISLMMAGRMVEQTSTADFFNTPRTVEGRAFLESERP